MKLSFNAVSKDLLDTIKESPKKGTSPYDAPAEVVRIDGDTAWVHISGGVEETPVRKTINCVAGDTVQIRVGGGSAWITGNATAPPTDDAKANIAYNYAETAIYDAERAKQSADNAEQQAIRAKQSADRAEASATSALTSAQNAQQSADSALVSLATVEDVVGVLNWITAHGTMTANGSTPLDPSKVYFIVDNNGDYEVGGTRYSIVSEPKAEERTSYYTLSVDESVQNYVATHIVSNTEGLWLIPDSGGNKVLIATGAGSSYTTAGTYIIGKVSGVDTVFAKFTTDGVTMNATNSTPIAHLGYGEGTKQEGGFGIAPYYTLGVRSGSIGNYSTVEGGKYIIDDTEMQVHEEYPNVASGYASHAEGAGCTASGHGSHAEGFMCTASGYQCSHAEGYYSTASGDGAHAEGHNTTASGGSSHAQNEGTIANGTNQTALGKYNVADTTSAVIIGNGTSFNSRSNALTVDWNGNVNIASGAKYKINGKSLSASDVGAVPTSRTINNKPLSSNITLSASDVGALATADVKNYVVGQGQYTGSLGLWTYRKWSDGYQEVWYNGSIQFTTASSVANGWHRATANVAIPISNMDGVSAFRDDSVITVSGSYSGRVFTHGGIKSNGTQFEAQQLGGASMATATIAGWNVYIAGYARA